jgi:putative ABC transport system substrate-binding protein
MFGSRRRLLVLIAFTLGSLGPRAQTATKRVAVFAPGTAGENARGLAAFYDEMSKLGWVEGRSVTYERFDGNDRQDETDWLARRVVAAGPNAIFAPSIGTSQPVLKETHTIPVVFSSVPDPVGMGLVRSLAFPGLNATGVSNLADEVLSKRLEVLFEILPKTERLGVLLSQSQTRRYLVERVMQTRFPTKQAYYAEIRAPEDIDTAIARLKNVGVDVLFPWIDSIASQGQRISRLARQANLPWIGLREANAEEGALFAFGPSLNAQMRAAARLMDKILRGARAGDLPVEQPTEFDFVVNKRAAQLYGANLAKGLLVRATRIVE